MPSSPDWLTSVEEVRPVSPWTPPDLFQVKSATAESPVSPVEEAYQRGWREGRDSLRNAEEIRAEALVSASEAARQAMNQAVEVLRHQLVATVHALSVAIARHLIEWEITQDPIHIRRLVNHALEMAPVNGPVTVRLNPDDFATLQQVDGLQGLSTDDSLELHWTPDPEIGRGGCVLEGPASIVDGRVDRALLDIYERLGHD